MHRETYAYKLVTCIFEYKVHFIENIMSHQFNAGTMKPLITNRALLSTIYESKILNKVLYNVRVIII